MRGPRLVVLQKLNYVHPYPLDNWFEDLNKLQSSFLFLPAASAMKVAPDRYRVPDTDGYDLERFAADIFRKRVFAGYPIFLTSLQYEDGSSAWHERSRWSIVSLADVVKDAVGESGMKGYFVESVVSALETSLDISTPLHDVLPDGSPDRRGCPNDYCDDLADLRVRKGAYCAECVALIEEAQKSGRISSEQFASLLRLLDSLVGRKTCFTIMPFGEEKDRWYQTTLAPLIRKGGFEPIRGDTHKRPFSIREDVLRDLCRADVVVADLDGKNPNVMYELGVAHAFHKRVVMLLPTGTVADADYRDIRHLAYGPAESDWQGSLLQMLGAA